MPLWQHTPRHGDILFRSVPYMNKIHPHRLAISHRQTEIKSLHLSLNTHTKVSLKDNHWLWMSHLTQVSWGPGRHKGPNTYTLQSCLWKCLHLHQWPHYGWGESGLWAHTDMTIRPLFTHQHSKVARVNLTTPVWTRWARAVTVMGILKGKKPHNQSEITTGFIFMHPTCNPGLTRGLLGTTLNTSHDVLKDHKSLWLSQYLSFSFKLWSYQKVWASSTSFIVNIQTENATVRGKRDTNTCLRVRPLTRARMPMNCHGKHLGQK